MKIPINNAPLKANYIFIPTAQNAQLAPTLYICSHMGISGVFAKLDATNINGYYYYYYYYITYSEYNNA